MATTRSVLDDMGFNRFNRKEDTLMVGTDVMPTNITEEIPLSVINQQIPNSSIDLSKTTIDTLQVNQYIRGGATGYNSGIGWWIGNDGSAYKLFIGNSAGNKLTWDGTTLTVSGAFVAGSIDIPDTTSASSWHVDTAGLQWAGANVANKATAPFRVNPTGEMTLGSTAGVHLQLSGPNVRIRSSNYVAGVSGFTVEPTLIEAENLVARGIMRGGTFMYDVVAAISGQVIVSNSDVLDADMTALDASTLTTRGSTTWAVNDMLLIRAVTASGIQEEWLRITNIGSAPTYTVTRDLAGSYAANSNPIWLKGTTVVKQGKSDGAATYSGGWLRLFGEGTNSPYYSVFSRTGIAYNAYSERVRLGNLNGIGGFVADAYGIFIGDYASGKYLTYDDVSGNLIVNGYLATTDAFVVWALAAGAYLGTGTVFGGGSPAGTIPIMHVIYSDGAIEDAWYSCKVPKGATTISSIKAALWGGAGGDVVTYIDVNQVTPAAVSTFDTTAPALTTTVSTSGAMATYGATSYNGITVTENSILNIHLTRDGTAGADTLAADMYCAGILVTFA